jgi:ProP effector
MTNPSLKDQLKALHSELVTHREPPKEVKSKKYSGGPQSKTTKKPGWLEQAQYGVELLKAYFPECFKEFKEIKPLKKGIKQDLVKFLSTKDDIVISDKACMVNSLAYYVNSIAYHRSVVESHVRVDLDGAEAGVVTAEEAEYSAQCRKSKLQKKQGGHTKQSVATT